MDAAKPIPRRSRYPRQIFYILGNEGAERFSFYGMTSILTVYMAKHLGFSEPDAEARYHLFTAAVYFAPLVGGWLSDRYLGRFRTIFWLSFGYVAGHAVLAFVEGVPGLYLGMVLIAMGAGGIKPCVSAFMGDQFTKDDEHLVEGAYGLFYFMINVGSLGGQLLIPKLLDWSGPSVAFGVPGIAMALALIIYVIGAKMYRRAPPSGANPNSFLNVVLAVFKSPKKPDRRGLESVRGQFPDEAVDGARAVVGIIALFSTVTVFWALFYQYGSSWVIQAEHMNLTFLGIKFASSQVSFLNSVFVLSLVPTMTAVYGALERRGRKVTALRKMTIGMFVATLSFVAAAVVQSSIDGGHAPNVAWQAIQYFFISLAEVLVSVTGLEFAYTQAPPSMKSTIMGLWFVAIGAGNLLTAAVAKANVFKGSTFFLFFAGLMFVAAVIFALIARAYRPVKFVPLSEATAPSEGVSPSPA